MLFDKAMQLVLFKGHMIPFYLALNLIGLDWPGFREELNDCLTVSVIQH